MFSVRHGLQYGFCTAGLLFASLAWSGPFDGLEMDVIAPGQTPKGPTSHIALPRAGAGRGPLAIDGASGYEDSIPDRLIRGEVVRSFGGDGGVGGNGGAGSAGLLGPGGVGGNGGTAAPEVPPLPPPTTARP